jgi:hypothetical protein
MATTSSERVPLLADPGMRSNRRGDPAWLFGDCARIGVFVNDRLTSGLATVRPELPNPIVHYFVGAD